MAEMSRFQARWLVIFGIVTLGLLSYHHFYVRRALEGQEPPYINRFRLLDLSDKPVEKVEVRVKQVPDADWGNPVLDTEEPIEPGQAWTPAENESGEQAVAVQVRAKVAGQWLEAEVNDLRDNADPEVGPEDAEVYAAVVGTGDDIELHAAVVYNLTEAERAAIRDTVEP